MFDLDYPVIIAKKKNSQPHHLIDRVGLFRLVGIGFRLFIFAVRFVFLKKKKGTARYRSPNPSLSSFLFSPAFFCFCSGRGAYCVVVCCYGVCGRIRFGFLRQTVLFFSSLLFHLHHNLIQPNITSILDHFFVEF